MVVLTQMSSAGGAAKALQVEHFGLGSHHKIVFGENILAGRAASRVKPEIGEKIHYYQVYNDSCKDHRCQCTAVC